jgi:hypothetical protein
VYDTLLEPMKLYMQRQGWRVRLCRSKWRQQLVMGVVTKRQYSECDRRVQSHSSQALSLLYTFHVNFATDQAALHKIVPDLLTVVQEHPC